MGATGATGPTGPTGPIPTAEDIGLGPDDSVTFGKIRLSDTAWDDLRFPAQAINPPGSAADPIRNQATGVLEFRGEPNAKNTIAGVAQMPHTWKRGTDVYPHLHLRFPYSTTGTSYWTFEYDMADADTNFTNAYGTYTSLTGISVLNPGNTGTEALESFGPLSMTGMSESAVIMWRVNRDRTNTKDTDTGNIPLLEFDIHYEVEKLGTDDQIPPP